MQFILRKNFFFFSLSWPGDGDICFVWVVGDVSDTFILLIAFPQFRPPHLKPKLIRPDTRIHQNQWCGFGVKPWRANSLSHIKEMILFFFLNHLTQKLLSLIEKQVSVRNKIGITHVVYVILALRHLFHIIFLFWQIVSYRITSIFKYIRYLLNKWMVTGYESTVVGLFYATEGISLQLTHDSRHSQYYSRFIDIM